MPVLVMTIAIFSHIIDKRLPSCTDAGVVYEDHDALAYVDMRLPSCVDAGVSCCDRNASTYFDGRLPFSVGPGVAYADHDAIAYVEKRLPPCVDAGVSYDGRDAFAYVTSICHLASMPASATRIVMPSHISTSVSCVGTGVVYGHLEVVEYLVTVAADVNAASRTVPRR